MTKVEEQCTALVMSAEKPVIRPLDDEERAAARERESCNRKR